MDALFAPMWLSEGQGSQERGRDEGRQEQPLVMGTN